MANWFVRPDTTHSNVRNGESYETAWGGISELSGKWGVGFISLSDTLYMCGFFPETSSFSQGAHGATSPDTAVTIRGDYYLSKGAIAFTGSAFVNGTRNWTTFRGLTIYGSSTTIAIQGSMVNGFVVDSCEVIGGVNGVVIGTSVAVRSATIQYNHIHGQSDSAIRESINATSTIASGVVIRGNTIHDAAKYGINIDITSVGWPSSKYSSYFIENNRIYDCPGPSIYFRSCNNDLTTEPTLYSDGVVVSGNNIRNCGTIAGVSGNHGGLLLMGCISPLVVGNVVRDCYVTGAGLQTAKNIAALIIFNDISGIRSGTPLTAYQNGLPIDGNGIFFDNLSKNGLAFGNRISDLVTTGNAGSGAALAFWDCTNCTYTGNIVDNVACGTIYGDDSESGNVAYNNVFMNAGEVVRKVGALSLTGNFTVKNNIMKDCATGFLIGSNPYITADYNCLHGCTTNYSGISAGANDVYVDPELDGYFVPQAASLLTAGQRLGGADYRGCGFFGAQPIGALASRPSTSKVSRTIATRTIASRSVAPRRA